jgi:hypothetical protein
MGPNQMTKFCIELEGVMLPDAIAAVVEAWYDAQNTESFDWVTDLRMQIKREFGRGWTLDAVQKTKLIPHGLCRLTKKPSNGSRTSIVLQIGWLPKNAKLIFRIAHRICRDHIEFDLTLRECLDRALGMEKETIELERIGIMRAI